MPLVSHPALYITGSGFFVLFWFFPLLPISVIQELKGLVDEM